MCLIAENVQHLSCVYSLFLLLSSIHSFPHLLTGLFIILIFFSFLKFSSLYISGFSLLSDELVAGCEYFLVACCAMHVHDVVLFAPALIFWGSRALQEVLALPGPFPLQHSEGCRSDAEIFL